MSVVVTIEAWMRFQGLKRCCMSGRIIRISRVATPKQDKITPMVVADRPMSTP